jgi:hypothetical protein
MYKWVPDAAFVGECLPFDERVSRASVQCQLVVCDMVLHAPRFRMRIVVSVHHGSVCRDEWLCVLLQFIRLLLIALSRWDQMQQDKRLEPVPIRQVVSDEDYSYTQGT